MKKLRTAVLDFLALDNFVFTRKIVKIFLSEKLVEMLEICTFLVVDIFYFPRKIVKFCQNRIFGKKVDFSNSVVFTAAAAVCM